MLWDNFRLTVKSFNLTDFFPRKQPSIWLVTGLPGAAVVRDVQQGGDNRGVLSRHRQSLLSLPGPGGGEQPRPAGRGVRRGGRGRPPRPRLRLSLGLRLLVLLWLVQEEGSQVSVPTSRHSLFPLRSRISFLQTPTPRGLITSRGTWKRARVLMAKMILRKPWMGTSQCPSTLLPGTRRAAPPCPGEPHCPGTSTWRWTPSRGETYPEHIPSWLRPPPATRSPPRRPAPRPWATLSPPLSTQRLPHRQVGHTAALSHLSW